jgi:hypothetical protein
MDNPLDFAKQYGAVANQVGQRLKVDPQILLGQWGLETGWGKSVVPGTNNFGNIKDFSGAGVAAADNATGSNDNYQKFDSPQAFGDHYSDLIERKYPNAVGAGADPVKFATALKSGGYAEDPKYINKIVNVTGAVRKQPGILDMLAAAVFPAAQAGELPKQNKVDLPPDVLSSLKWEDVPPAGPATAGYGKSVDLAPEVLNSLKWEPVANSSAGGGPPQSTAFSDGKGDSVQLHYDAPPPTQDAVQKGNGADSIGRQLGLTARAAVTGAAALPSMMWNGPAGVINQYAGTSIPKANVEPMLDAIGLPQPRNGTERVAQDVAGAMAGTGGLAKAADTVATKAAKPVSQAIARLFAAAPRGQILTAASGSSAGGIARENGASPGGQLAAAIAGSLTPNALATGGQAALRGALRGGEEGRLRMLANIAAFNKAGASPTVGQATEGRLAQALESTLSRTPGGAGVITRKAVGQTGDIAQNVDSIVNSLSPNAGSVEAGESITRGLEGFKAGVKAHQTSLYNKLDEFLPAKTPITVGRTKEALGALNSDIEGAPALSAMFKNGRIQGIEHALVSDLATDAKPYGHRLTGEPAKPVPTLPYESIKKLRTLVGREIDNANFTSDVPRDKWRALYAALSEDLGDAARNAGPQARDAWAWANRYSRTQLGRLDDLKLVAGKDAPEKVFQAALQGSADGDTVLRRVINAIPKENRKDLAAAVLKRMGRATAGNQDESGEAFSIGTFLTNWAKMSPRARQALFARTGDSELLDEVANLAGVASNIRDGSKVFANPSGTSGAAASQMLGVGGVMSALTGNVPAMAGAAGVPIGANLAARFMTNPKNLRMLSQSTRIPPPVATGTLQAISSLFPDGAKK